MVDVHALLVAYTECAGFALAGAAGFVTLVWGWRRVRMP